MMKNWKLFALLAFAIALFAYASYAEGPKVTEEREPVGAIKSLKVVDDTGKTRLTITAKNDTLILR